MSLRVPRFLIVLVLTALIGCAGKADLDYSASPAPEPSSDAPPWPRPRDTIDRGKRVGVDPDRKEYGTFHIHAHLDVFVNGRAVTVPGGIGIDVRDPEVNVVKEPGKGTSYGGIKLCEKPCIAALHTHGEDGVVHVEAKKRADYRLGQFFELWDVRLSSRCVGGYCGPSAPIAVFIDGERLRTNAADLIFEDRQEIAIVIGSPPKTIPSEFPGE